MRPALLLLLASCQVHTQGDKEGAIDDTGEGPRDSGDTDTDEDQPGTCAEADLSPGTVPTDSSCDGSPAGFGMVLEWSNIDIGGSLGNPVVGQLTDDNGDGFIGRDDVPDIVTYTTYNEVVLLSGDGSGVHWVQDTLGGYVYNIHPAIGDVDLDGLPEIIALKNLNGEYGVVSLDAATGAIEWETDIGAAFFHPNGAAMSLVDLEGDGTVEIVLGNAVLAGEDGALLWAGGEEDGKGNLVCEQGLTQDRRVLSVAADVDLDGVAEVVTGSMVYGPDGSIETNGGPTDGAVAVVQLDDDEEIEVVVTFAYNLCSEDGAFVRVQNFAGTKDWQVDVGGWLSGVGLATVADFDGDGDPEIAVVTSEYDSTGSTGVVLASLLVLDNKGNQKWRADLPVNHTLLGGGSVSAIDIDGDGASEIIHQGYDTIRIFEGRTGAVVAELAGIETNNPLSAPVLADVDGDGHMEIVVAGHDPTQEWMDGGIWVIGAEGGGWPRVGQIWSQQTYREGVVDTQLRVAGPTTPGSLFRAIERPPLAPHDAVPLVSDLCTEECDQGRVELVARIGSGGTEALPAGTTLRLEAWDGAAWVSLDSFALEAELPAGESSEGHLFQLDPAELPEGDLRLVVDALDIDECDESNNTTTIDGPLCE